MITKGAVEEVLNACLVDLDSGNQTVDSAQRKQCYGPRLPAQS